MQQRRSISQLAISMTNVCFGVDDQRLNEHSALSTCLITSAHCMETWGLMANPYGPVPPFNS
jgi:hypothetical protein